MKLQLNEFCDELGISSSTISQNVSGTDPRFITLDKILTAFPQVNAEWLMRGEGEPLNNSTNEILNNEILNNELHETTSQYKTNKKEKPAAALPDDVAVLKKAVELLQIEMWKLKAEVGEMKRKVKN